jgi:putative SOS response-associated peptidase YedK
MLITNANELASKIHDRMPVLLQPSDFDGWLAGNAGSDYSNQRLMTICRHGRCRGG